MNENEFSFPYSFVQVGQLRPLDFLTRCFISLRVFVCGENPRETYGLAGVF